MVLPIRYLWQCICVVGLLLTWQVLQCAGETIPKLVRNALTVHCGECHFGDSPEGDINLKKFDVEWQTTEAIDRWVRVYEALTQGEMPPREADQPSDKDRRDVLAWLEKQLGIHSPIGGTGPRRLNRQEYQNTIRNVFDLKQFQLPDSFPADDSAFGFDNVAAGLAISPPLLAQLVALATSVADEVLPPQQATPTAVPKVYRVGVSGLATGEGGSAMGGERYRIVSSRNMASAAVWPARFEATQSGVYRLTVKAKAVQTENMAYPHRESPFALSVYVRPKTDQVYDPYGKLRKAVEFQLAANGDEQTFSASIELTKGEMCGLRWSDGPAYSDPPRRDYSTKFLADRLMKSRRFYAAILEYQGGPRGINQSDYYDAIAALMTGDGLDMDNPRLDKLPEKFGGGLANAPHNWISKFVHEELRRYGPAIDITDVVIEGPIKLVEDEETRARKARSRAFLGVRPAGLDDRQYAKDVLGRFLPRLFRRPVESASLKKYVDLVVTESTNNLETGLEDGLHLAVRRALVSPDFIYREGLQPGRLDDFGLASRLSFFLTSSPPDRELIELASQGILADTSVLRSQAERLLASSASIEFVKSFTGQWLGTRRLSSIMADPRLLPFFDADRDALIKETELFFAEMIRENHSIDSFIDPGFSYRNASLNKVYGDKLQGRVMQRVTFDRGGRHGGLLGLASVMMATANGVDTHPVHRGVWLMDNVFGKPVPPPSDNVPAIAPDTTGATTIRRQLEAHRADQACARCHDEIDPLGIVMENFDPVGRWRDHYPVYTKPSDGETKLKKEFYSSIGKGTQAGPQVDSRGVLPDGTVLRDVTDLKRYVVENIDVFSECLTKKLLVYATGRKLSFGDKCVARDIVADVKTGGNRFRDLIVAVVLSESFATN